MITVGRPAADVGRLAAYLLVAGPLFRMWGPNKEAVGRMREEVRTGCNCPSARRRKWWGRSSSTTWSTEALVFPTNLRDPNAPAKVVEHAQRYYEETWIHQPRRSLAGNTPIDAAGHANLRKKLRGVVQFIQECAAGSLLGGYDFDRLRRKARPGRGRDGRAPTPTLPHLRARAGRGAAPTADVSAMSAAELGGLNVESLTDEQLEQAFHAAQKLDAGDLAAPLRAHPDRPSAAAGDRPTPSRGTPT